MKKVFLSLLLAIACVPMAFSQNKAGDVYLTDTTICGSYTWSTNGATYTQDTVVVLTTDTATHVLILHMSNTFIDTAVARELTGYCYANYNNKRWVVNGTYMDTVRVANQCDTLVKVHVDLTVPHPDTTNTIVNAGCSYNWQGTTITDTNVHTKTFTSVEGCDSIVNLKVNFSGITNIDTTIVACDRYIHGNDTITADTTFVIHDSTATCHTYTTVHLTIAPSYSDTTVIDTVGGCEIVWGGRTYRYTTVGQTVYDNVRTAYGCDSIVGLHIVGFDSTQYRELNSILDTCFDYTFVYHTMNAAGTSATSHSVVFTQDGTYDTAFDGTPLMQYSNSKKCKTYYTLNLTLKQPEQRYRADIVDTACDRFTLKFNNTFYTTPRYAPTIFDADPNSDITYIDSTVISHAYADGEHCYDSIVHVNLVIYKRSYNDTTVKACDRFTWPVNNNVYTESEVVEVASESKNIYGCDSINRLNLTVNATPQAHIEGIFDQTGEQFEATTLRAVYEGTGNVTYQWYINDNAVPGARGKADSLVVDAPTGNPIYNTDVRLETTAHYANSHTCTGSNWITLTYNLGIDDIDALQVNIYPNPASRFLNLESAEGLSEVTVYNALGQQVIARSVNADAIQLDLGNLVAGNYTLRIVSQNGNETTRKFIVNK